MPCVKLCMSYILVNNSPLLCRDVYDTDEEQSAVRLLEKYLTNDITHMVCQNNNTLSLILNINPLTSLLWLLNSLVKKSL